MIKYQPQTNALNIISRSQMKKWKTLLFKIALLVVIAIVVTTA